MRGSKLFAFVGVAALVLALGAGCGDDDKNGNGGSDKFKIALLAPFSGPLEGIGQAMKNAVSLAIDEINKGGGLTLDGKTWEIELVSKDDGTDGAISKAAAEEIAKDAKVMAIIGPATSGSCKAVAEAMTGQGLTSVTASGTAPSLTNPRVSPYFWRTIANDSGQGKVAAEYALAEGKSKAAILHIDNSYGKGLADAFEKKFTEDSKGEIVAKVTYAEETSYDSFDFTQQASDIFTATPTPDVVFMVTYNEDGAKFTTYAKAVMPNPPPLLMGCDGNKGSDFTAAADSSVIDQMQGTAPVPPSTDANYKAYSDRYKAVYKQDPKIFSEGTYDALYLLAYALQKAGKAPARTAFSQDVMQAVSGAGAGASGTKINVNEWKKGKDELTAGKEINYEGASGIIDWDSKGDVASGMYEIWRWDGTAKDWEQLKTVKWTPETT